MYRNAVYWFVLLLIIIVAGFWPSYFAQLGGAGLHHHLHAVPMLAWVLLLIVQAWLIRSRRRPLHRKLGRFSLVLAPLVFVAGIHVVGVDIAKRDLPYGTHDLGIFWFGLFLAFAYVLFYVLAIRHRRNLPLHQRWMAATALVFLIPGLGRLSGNLGQATGLPTPDFGQTLWVPLIFSLILILREWRAGHIYNPWPVFAVLWTINIWAFNEIYRLDFFRSFAHWMASLWSGFAPTV